jgi:hypothetical protein
MKRVLLFLAALVLLVGRAHAQVAACCAITAIQPTTGVVTAKVNSNANVFEFTVTDARTLATLRVGQGVFANMTTKQVSLDGRSACCRITSGPSSAPATVVPPVGGRPTTTAPAAAPPTATEPSTGTTVTPVAAPAVRGAIASFTMPTVTYGAPQPRTAVRTPATSRFESRSVSALVGGRNVTHTVMHLRGLDGIEKAPGLADGARRLLEMHVRTLAAGEADHYIVDPQLAAAWVAAHPVPASVKPSDNGGDSHSGCDVISTHCAGEAGKHVIDQGSQELDKLRQQAIAEWNHVSTELSHDWNMAEGCFADHTLPLPDIPVQFSITPEMTLHLEQSGSKDLGGGGSASGKVQGSVTLGFPMKPDFRAELDLFYIPCLPFAVRPKSIGGIGTMMLAEQLTAQVTATGKFDKVFTIPPLGGPRIPIEVIPIVIAGVPVAELDVSAYIEGNVEVGGSGKADGHFQLTNPHSARFDFACSGGGCTSSAQTIPDPTTTTEGAQIQGQVFVKPAVFTALQLDFDFDALGARAGPQPYLWGAASGCAAVAGAQTIGGVSSGAENHVLAADLDWGVDIRADALVGGQPVGKFQHSVTGNKHLWFRDMYPGGSNALVVTVAAPKTGAAGKAVGLKAVMPSCYPYTNPIQYRVSWTGAATPGATSACQWQGNQGTCTADPTKDLPMSLTWNAAGSYTVSVVAVSDSHSDDRHRRVFSPAPPATQIAVSVSP